MSDMTSIELVTLLTKIASESFASKLAEKGSQTFINEIANLLGLNPNAKEQKHLVTLLDDSPLSWPSLQRLSAELHTADRHGIMFVGPSGGGKTTLMKALLQRTASDLTTTEVDTEFALLAGRITALHDAPGQVAYETRIIEALKRIRPTILVLVVADGYLDNLTFKDQLAHPDLGPRLRTFRKTGTYVAAARELELGWLENLTRELAGNSIRSVQYCVLFVNKRELWHPSPEQDYSGQTFQDALDKLASKLSQTGTRFLTVHGSARYDGFKKRQAPVAGFSSADSLASIRAFKALLKALLLERR